MGKKCFKQCHTYHECCLTSDITTLSQFSNFGLKYHLPRLQSPVCPLPQGFFDFSKKVFFFNVFGLRYFLSKFFQTKVFLEQILFLQFFYQNLFDQNLWTKNFGIEIFLTKIFSDQFFYWPTFFEQIFFWKIIFMIGTSNMKTTSNRYENNLKSEGN